MQPEKQTSTRVIKTTQFLLLTTALLLTFLAGCRKNYDAVSAPGRGTPSSGGPGNQADPIGDSLQLIGRSCNTWICLPSDLPFPSYWTTFPPNGSYLAGGAAVASGSKIYFGGGREEGDYTSDFDDIYFYDTFTGTWNTSLKLSLARSHLSAAHAGKFILFAGGKHENIYNRGNPDYFDRVDLIDTLSFLRQTASLSQPRAHMAAASEGDLAFFAGGLTNDGHSSKTMDVYEAVTNNWKRVDMPEERAYGGAAIVNGKLYIAGGINKSLPEPELKSVDIYDIVSGTWSRLTAPHPHPIASVIALQEKIYIAGGDNQANRTLDIYDTRNDTWRTEELSDSRNNIGATAGRNHIIFIGGSYSDRIDIYNTESGTWYRSKLNTGVNEVMAASVDDLSLFAGFFYLHGKAVPNTVWAIKTSR
jgi:N-acetylneuraminic acid mutarotase